MKKLIVLVIVLVFYGVSFAQSNKWSTVEYLYSKGPVAPEYQYNYTITIDNAGVGKLSYTKSSLTNDYDFSIGPKSLKRLNKALNKSQVFTAAADEMKADKNMVGGPSRSLNVTMWQPSNVDQKPTVIMVPSQVSEKYEANINSLYDLIENLVPKKIWNQATGQ